MPHLGLTLLDSVSVNDLNLRAIHWSPVDAHYKVSSKGVFKSEILERYTSHIDSHR